MQLWFASKPFSRLIKSGIYSAINTFVSCSAIITVLSYFTGSYFDTKIWSNQVNRCIAYLVIACIFVYWWKKGRYQKYVCRNLLQIADIAGRRVYYFENDSSIREGTVIQIMEHKNGMSIPFAIAIVDSVDELHGNRMKVQHYAFIGSDSKHIVQENIKNYFYYPHVKRTGFENMHKE